MTGGLVAQQDFLLLPNIPPALTGTSMTGGLVVQHDFLLLPNIPPALTVWSWPLVNSENLALIFSDSDLKKRFFVFHKLKAYTHDSTQICTNQPLQEPNVFATQLQAS